MRMVIVGGTGNVGTAVLDAAVAAGWDVAGVSRRPPAAGAPYGAAAWHAMDLSEPAVGPRLAEVFAGADAVVHAAWAIQPSRDREYLRRVNVTGSGVVMDAVAAAGVPQLVQLSSVGAYTARESGDPVAEDWPVDGVPSSSYSQDKAAVETMLDHFEAAHPEVAVTRLRPALVLQRRSASEQQRYFVGALVPGPAWKLARRGKLPLVPLPSGLTVQFVHASDVASAVVSAVELRYRGAVNLAADPILDAHDLAAAFGGRVVRVPGPLVRGAAALAWRARLLPMSPGWVDLALASPVMRTDRARAELGWVPRWNAHETLADLLAGLADGDGVPSSPVLRPRHG